MVQTLINYMYIYIYAILVFDLLIDTKIKQTHKDLNGECKRTRINWFS